MAHAVETMVSGQNLVPWHGLGKVVAGAMTAEEAITMAGMDWSVEKRQLFIPQSDDTLIEVPGHYGIVRTDRDEKNVLGVCKKNYTPLQNREAFTFFDSVVSNKEAIYHTAGVLHDGKRVWILAQLPGEIVVNGQDISKKYVLLSNGHDGGSSVLIKLTAVRVVCANTLALALNEAGQFMKIRHGRNVVTRVQEAAVLMGFANKMYAELNEAFSALSKRELKGEELERYFGRLFPDSDAKIEKALELVEAGAGADLPGVRGTAWGALNAVTELVDHHGRQRSDDGRLNNAWFGIGNNTKVQAFENALALL